MHRLWRNAKLDLCISLIYNADQVLLKVFYLNVRSLQRHIHDVLNDMNNLSTNVNIFSKTRFSNYVDGNMYALNNYTLFRNDDRIANINGRPLMVVWHSIVFLISIQATHILELQWY